jgi:hypothetical protein
MQILNQVRKVTRVSVSVRKQKKPNLGFIPDPDTGFIQEWIKILWLDIPIPGPPG